MEIEQTPLKDVYVITPARFQDSRGFFSESWNKKRLAEKGIDLDFVQDNHSFSFHKNTLRGLHFQAPSFAQAKLVRCSRGSLWDVAVDIRKGSPTYGKSFGTSLSFENGKQILIPEGFLHGFITLEDETEIAYKCNAFYNQLSDGAVLWSSCDINWPFNGTPLLSEKDTEAQNFSEFDSPFNWAAS